MTEEQMDRLAREIYEAAMTGARGAMRARRVSFDTADYVANGVYASVRQWVERNQARLAPLAEEERLSC